MEPDFDTYNAKFTFIMRFKTLKDAITFVEAEYKDREEVIKRHRKGFSLWRKWIKFLGGDD